MAQAEQIIYDTHAAVRRLTDAGLSEGQAEAVVGEYLLLIRHNLATKDDIRGVRDEIEKLRLTTDAKLEELRLATEAKIATAKTSIILWIVGLVVGLDAMLGIAPEAIAWVAGTLFKA